MMRFTTGRILLMAVLGVVIAGSHPEVRWHWPQSRENGAEPAEPSCTGCKLLAGYSAR